MVGEFLEFRGPTRWLSNFDRTPVRFDGVEYKTAEHAYQAQKTMVEDERRRIRECNTPAEAKRMGRTVTLRPDWEKVKLAVMESVVYHKFAHNTDLRDKLLETGGAELVEGNNWGDRYWGRVDGRGENHLGKILMRVRAKLASKGAETG